MIILQDHVEYMQKRNKRNMKWGLSVNLEKPNFICMDIFNTQEIEQIYRQTK